MDDLCIDRSNIIQLLKEVMYNISTELLGMNMFMLENKNKETNYYE